VLAGVVGIASAGITVDWRYIGVPLLPLAAFAILRFSMPAEGVLARRLCPTSEPETAAFFRFSVLWLLIANIGAAAYQLSQSSLWNAQAVLLAGIVVWSLVLVSAAGVADRRRDRREREAAELRGQLRGDE
jgi:hypothetical protein